MNTCVICIDPFDKHNRKEIVCKKCALSACIRCHLQYHHTIPFLNKDPHCMKCKTPWDVTFMATNVPRYAMKRLSAYKEKALLHNEILQLNREKDTKPCPSCAAHIYKTGGCNHMVCTQCKTEFSWENGNIQVLNPVVHTPPFFENSAQTPSYHTLLQHCVRTYGHDNRSKFIMNTYRLAVHIHQVEIKRIYATDWSKSIQPMRKKWLQKKISNAQFGKFLFKKYTLDRVNQCTLQVFMAFVKATGDVFKNDLTLKTRTIILELLHLIKCANSLFKQIWKVYRCKISCIRLLRSYEFVILPNGLLPTIHYSPA